MAQAADNQTTHQRGIAKAHLGLGGMDVHIHILRWQSEEQRDERMAVMRQHVHISGAHCTKQQAVAHRAAIDEEILMALGGLIKRG